MNFDILHNFNGLLWFLGTLLALTLLQRALHRNLQAIFLILTRHPGVTMVLFSLIFLPGVFLHELSHFIMAWLLGVPTGSFSLLPRPLPNGRLQLGYVETARAGLIKDALIGVAPLVAGCLFLTLTAFFKMNLLPLWEALRNWQMGGFWIELTKLPDITDFWLWFYLIFTISSTMMPSASDRHAWLPLGLIAMAVIAVAGFVGAGSWMLAHLAPPLDDFLDKVSSLFGLSAVVHLALLLPVLLIHRLLARLTGEDVE